MPKLSESEQQTAAENIRRYVKLIDEEAERLSWGGFTVRLYEGPEPVSLCHLYPYKRNTILLGFNRPTVEIVKHETKTL